jgi:hypothetical protein
VTRLFEKEYGLPVNSNPTDPRSRVRTFRMAALCSPIIASRQHRLHSSNRCVGRTLTIIITLLITSWALLLEFI